MVHFNLSTRVNFAGKRRLKPGHYKGQIKHCVFALIQMTNDSFQSFGMPLDYYSIVCILSSLLI